MPSALEIYYRNKKEGKKTSEPSRKLAAKEFLGLDIPRKNIGFFHRLMDILDRPGNATRALLVGKLGGLKGLIPFAQTIENLTGIDIALNKEDLVTGTQVIEKWFGKQRQKKGKLDPVDVLGFLVEVAADPIWLLGIGGLTKTGKAVKLAKSGIQQAKATGNLVAIRKMIKAAKAGQKIDNSKLSKAFLTWYKSGGKPLAKTWAQQAAKGQRALVKFAGKPLIRGEKALGAFEKFSTKFKTGAGKIFYTATRRVPDKYKELHDIYVHFGRDLPAVKQRAYFEKIQKLFDEGAKSGKSAKEMDELVRGYIQRAYAGEGGKRWIAQRLAKRQKLAAQKIKRLKPQLKTAKNPERIAKQIQYQRQIFGKGLKKTKEGVVDVEAIRKIKSAIGKRETQAAEMLKGLPKGQTKAVQELGGKYHKLGEIMPTEELAKGVPSKKIFYPLGYAHRAPTDEFRRWMELNRHRPVVSSFARDLSAKNPAQRTRNKILGWMTDEEALDYFRKLGYEGQSVFEKGMAYPTLRRGMMSARSIGAADTINEAMKKFSKPDMPIWRSKGYNTLTDDIFKRSGVVPTAEMTGRLVPDEVANALLEMHSLATSDEALSQFWKTWTGTQRYMKGVLTMPWPAYHTRNMFSNFVLNWLGGVKNPQSYLEALRLQMGKGGTIRLPSGAVLSADDIMRHADDWGVVRRSVGMFEPSEILPRTMQRGRTPVRTFGMKVGTGIEDNARLAHFIDKLKTGYSFQDAAASAKNVLFDYGDLSKVEKKYFRDRGIFFYTFMRKNLPLQAKALLQEPGKQSFWSHVMGGTPEILGNRQEYPDWWREQLVTRPFMKTAKGEEVRFAGMGMPLEEAFGSFAGPGYSPWDRLQRIAGRQFGKLSPLVTAPTEFITDRDIFYNRPIGDIGYAPYFTKYLPEKAKNVLGVREISREGRQPYYTMSPRVSWALRKSPLSRIWSSASMLTQEGQPLGVSATHFLFGQKPRIYNPEIAKERQIKKSVNMYLEEQFKEGKLRKFQRFYNPRGIQSSEQTELLLKSQ